MLDWLIPAAAAAALTLSVGPNGQFKTLSEALTSIRYDLTKSNTVITLASGTYTGEQVKNYYSGWDYLTVPVTIQGDPKGPRVVIKEGGGTTGASGAGKGWFVPWARNVKTDEAVPGTWIFRHLDISDARRGDQYGSVSGIRTENGWPASVVIDDCYIHNNDNGLLGPEKDGTLVITHSVFDRNGAGDGYSHDAYVGFATTATVSDSEFRRANVGHDFKSRAMVSTLTRVKLIDGPDGTASYDADFPNGGKVLIADSLIEKGPKASNNFAVHIGGEDVKIPPGGVMWPGTEVTIRNTTFVNDKPGAVAILNQSERSGGLDITVLCEDCRFYGFDQSHVGIGKVRLVRPTFLTARPDAS